MVRFVNVSGMHLRVYRRVYFANSIEPSVVHKFIPNRQCQIVSKPYTGRLFVFSHQWSVLRSEP